MPIVRTSLEQMASVSSSVHEALTMMQELQDSAQQDLIKLVTAFVAAPTVELADQIADYEDMLITFTALIHAREDDDMVSTYGDTMQQACGAELYDQYTDVLTSM